MSRQSAAVVYVRRGTAFVVPMSRTVDGFWIESDPIVLVDRDEIGPVANGVREALSASEVDVATPPRGAIRSRLPELAGVKSYAAFLKGATSVDVVRDGDQITLTPMRNEGAGHGFAYLVDAALAVDDDGLADGLRRALTRSE